MNNTIENFAEICEGFCNWSEAPSGYGENEVQIAFAWLIKLVSSILQTPDASCGEEIEAPSTSEEEWKAVYNRFSSLPIHYYATHFRSYNLSEPEPVTGDLADDLADIYRDIKEGLWFYKNGYITEAVWSWRYSFQILILPTFSRQSPKRLVLPQMQPG